MFKRFNIVVMICLMALVANSSLLQAKSYSKRSQSASKSGYGFTYYPTKLDDVVQTIYKCPEARELLEQVNRDGPVGIVISDSRGYQASWDSYYRTISVSSGQNPSKGSYITSIIFELHNAASEKRLNHLTWLASKGQISKEAYVEGIERMEHQNAIKACTLLNKAIRQEIFPPDAEWLIFRKFDDHYQMQQMTGHSHQIADNYDHMNRHRKRDIYRGTMQEFRNLSHEEKILYSKFLTLKNDLESSNRDEIARATHYLQKEYDQLLRCYADSSRKGCVNWQKSVQMMEKVFKGNPVYELIIQKSPMITRDHATSTADKTAA